MLGNVHLAFTTILENLRKSSERGRKSVENHQKCRHQYVYTIKRTIHVKRKRHKCVIVYKCLNNLVPRYLSDYFTRNYNVHRYNTRRKTDLHLPKVKLSLAKRTFRYSGSALFNLLPRSMHKAESLSSFKILINTHNF